MSVKNNDKEKYVNVFKSILNSPFGMIVMVMKKRLKKYNIIVNEIINMLVKGAMSALPVFT